MLVGLDIQPAILSYRNPQAAQLACRLDRIGLTGSIIDSGRDEEYYMSCCDISLYDY
jgi:hypothetical protein